MAESLGTSVLDLTTDDAQLTSGMESAKDTAKKLGLAIGIAAGAAITAGAIEGIEREALNDQLAAQLDLTGKESQRAGRIAGGLYADAYGDSLEQVNSALAGIHANIGELGSFSDAEIEDMGAKALDLAKIMGEDVSRVTRGVGQLMRNDMAPNAETAFDMIFAAQSKVGQSMKGELLDTIEEYSADFASLGLDGQQAMAMVTAAVQAGARNTDLAADAVREFSIRTVDGSTLTEEAFQRLGMDADDMAARIAEGGPTAQAAMSEVIGALGGMGDKVAQEQVGVALFGTRFEEMGFDAVAAMDPATAGLDNMAGAADRMGDTLNDNAQTKITNFRRSIEGALAKVVEAPGILGDAAAGVAGFGQVLQPIGPALTGVGLIFGSQIAGMAKKAATGSASIVVSVAKASAATTASVARMVAGWVLLGVQSLIHAAKVALAWLIAMGPIGIIIAAVVGLVALIIANWDTIKEVIGAAWNWVRDKTGALWSWLQGAVSGAIDAIVGFIRGWNDKVVEIGGNIIQWFKDLPGKILSAVGNLGRLLAGKAKELIDGFIGGIKDKFNSVKDTLGDLTGNLTSWKGPARVDRVLLAEPAEDIMGGFADSLAVEAQRVVQPTLAQVTADMRVVGGDGAHVGDELPDEFEATLPLDLGEGIERVVDIKIRRRNRNVTRRTGAGAGRAR